MVIFRITALYRVTQKVSDLGGVDLDLECSTICLGSKVAAVAAHQPWELPKSRQTQSETFLVTL